jgi:cytochrome c oxidase subunit 2
LPGVRRYPHLLPLTVIAVIVGGIVLATGLLIDWTPVQAAEQAERTDLLMWFLIFASGVIFTIVATVMIYAVWRFRAEPGDESDGPPMHGNTKLEVVWTVLPVLLLAVVAVWAYLVLTDNEALDDDRVEIEVTAEQFAWTFTYREQEISTGDLRVPVDRQVRLKMRAKDVIHDLYVAEFRVKQDVVPGITTYLTFNPTKTGTYQIICAELCGVGHGVMRSRVIVMPQDEYQRWLDASARRVQVSAAIGSRVQQRTQGAPADQTTTP